MPDSEQQRQIFQMQKDAFAAMTKALENSGKLKFSDFDIKTIEGKRGKEGYTPIKGKDYFTKQEMTDMSKVVLGMVKIPAPITGNPGKDAVVDYSKLGAFIKKEVLGVKIPTPDPGKRGEPGKNAVVDHKLIIDDVSRKLQGSFKLDNKLVDKRIEYTLERYNYRRPLTNSAGPRTRLEEMVDINIEGITNGQVLIYDLEAKTWGPGDGGGGGDNITNNTSTFLDAQLFNPDAGEVSADTADFTLSSANNVKIVSLNGVNLSPSQYSLVGTTLTVTPNNGFDNTSDEVLVWQETFSTVVPGGLILNYTEKTTNYTILATDYCINCTANAFTVTLPPAATVGAGKQFVVKNSGPTETVILEGNGSETIDGNLTAILIPGVSYPVMSTGNNWIIL